MASEEHTTSYYAASRNDLTTYPALEDHIQTDVCIIGGGFTGVACALTLAERGIAVAVIEQNRISWGASGRNGGQLIGGLGGTKHLSKHMSWDKIWQLQYRGNEIIKERVKKYNIDCDLKPGYIEVATKHSQMAGLQEDHDEHVEYGLGDQVRMVDQTEIQELLGTTSYVGGYLNNINGHLHPLNLCMGEARAAASLGAKIFEQSEVTSIEHGMNPKVLTKNGSVTAKQVLIAGNAYHRLEQNKLSGLVFPAGSYIIGTEPLSDNMVEKINPQDIAVCDVNNILDYYRLSADKRMLFGGQCNYSGYDPVSIKDNMRPKMLKVYPELEDMEVEFEWGGKIGIVPKRVPTLGRVADNVFYSMGYSGHGVAPTHIAAEVIANAMGGDTEVLDAYEKVKHFRIPGTRWFGNQMIAAGMLYYRARDLMPF